MFTSGMLIELENAGIICAQTGESCGEISATTAHMDNMFAAMSSH